MAFFVNKKPKMFFRDDRISSVNAYAFGLFDPVGQKEKPSGWMAFLFGVNDGTRDTNTMP